MNLKYLRNSKKITQREISDALDIPFRSYQDYESGRTEMRYSTLIKIADFFGCSIDFLLGHQTQNTLQLEGLSETQLKLVDMIKMLTPEQSYFALGYFSDMLKIPYSQVRPVRPF